jgi:hypothetical protein
MSQSRESKNKALVLKARSGSDGNQAPNVRFGSEGDAVQRLTGEEFTNQIANQQTGYSAVRYYQRVRPAV